MGVREAMSPFLFFIGARRSLRLSARMRCPDVVFLDVRGGLKDGRVMAFIGERWHLTAGIDDEEWTRESDKTGVRGWEEDPGVALAWGCRQ